MPAIKARAVLENVVESGTYGAQAASALKAAVGQIQSKKELAVVQQLSALAQDKIISVEPGAEASLAALLARGDEGSIRFTNPLSSLIGGATIGMIGLTFMPAAAALLLGTAVFATGLPTIVTD